MTRTGRPAVFYLLAWVLATLLVLWWTLLPFRLDGSAAALSRAVGGIQWMPFREHGRPPLWSDLAGNLALFTPFGFAAWRYLDGRRHRLLRVLGAALLLSFAVETLQLACPARRTSATDFVTDGMGAVVGAVLGRLWEVRLRQRFLGWTNRLASGDSGALLTALFAGCLLLWAVVPGEGPSRDLWTQTQVFTSSFRRFPGWSGWLESALHPVAMGLCFGVLTARSFGGRRTGAVLSGWLAAGAVGVLLELFQLAVPTRQPDVYQAVAFALGGFPGAVAGVSGRAAAVFAAAAAAAVALAVGPVGDSPAAVTRTAILFGAALVVAGTPWRRALRWGSRP